MPLPNAENAYVPLSKITRYLLSETHSVGRAKARFFRALGFNERHQSFCRRRSWKLLGRAS
jgi:hypothetical protein